MKNSVKISIGVLSAIIICVVGFFIWNKVIKNQDNGKNKIEQVNLSDENKLNILGYSYNFNSVEEISSGDMIRLAFHAIHKGWVPVRDTEKSDYVEDLGFPYSESYIKGIIYSLFGVEIKDNTPNVGEGITYNEGKFYFEWGDGDPVPQAINIQKENKDGITCYTYDVIYDGNVGIGYSGEKYEVGIDNNGFVKYKRNISSRLFDNIESMKYDEKNASDTMNGIVAILNAGEKQFITEQKDDYFIYKDELGNTYEIKNFTSIQTMDKLVSADKNWILFDCMLTYVDKDENYTDDDGNVFNVEVAVVVDKDLKNIEFHATADKYIESEKSKRNFSYDIDY